MTRYPCTRMMLLRWPGWIRATTGVALFWGIFFVGGCSPTFNWRELTLQDSGGLIALFPCKPDVISRVMPLPDLPSLNVRLWSCRAGDHVWSVAMTDLPDAGLIPLVLANWSKGVEGRAGYRAQGIDNLKVPGATPQLGVRSWKSVPIERLAEAQSRRPVGWTWHFSHGMRVYQASVWDATGSELPTNSEDVVSTFKNGFYFQK